MTPSERINAAIQAIHAEKAAVEATRQRIIDAFSSEAVEVANFIKDRVPDATVEIESTATCLLVHCRHRHWRNDFLEEAAGSHIKESVKLSLRIGNVPGYPGFDEAFRNEYAAQAAQFIDVVQAGIFSERLAHEQEKQRVDNIIEESSK